MDIIDGQYISNGSKGIYTKKTGEGSPTVVIEPGWGGLSAEWDPIQRALSKITTVISYDRAGYGESPKGDMPRSAEQVADELFNILNNLGEPGPIVLVGHSGGGLYCQQFAKMFPRYVSGMVLVDSITVRDREFEKLDAPKYHELMSLETRLRNIRKIAELEKEEFNKNIAPLVENLYQEFPDDLRHQLIAYQSDKQFYEAIVAEFEAYEESIEQNIRMGDNFPEIPLKVLCRDYKVMVELSKKIGVPEEEARLAEELWLKNEQSLCELSSESEFILVKNASHNIHIERPEVIAAAVKDIIDKTRK
jgi:pimeloyl-ACP methyl ester carboxylesterase